MADTVTTQSATLATIPASTVIATDDAGAAGHVQIVKLAVSTDGSATALTADNTDGLLVNLGANNDVTVASLPLPSGAATSAKQDTAAAILTTIDADTGSIATSASTLAGAVSGTEMQVDVLTMPTVAVTGTFWQATQPVSAASLPLPSGAATAAKQPALGTAGSASADVITIQGIASGTVVPVSDDGGSLTVDGTVAATQSGTWNVTNVSGTVSLPTGASTLAEQQSQTTHLSNIATSVGTLDNAIAGNEMQVDVVGALPAGTNAIGKLAANSGVDIGDVDVTSLPKSSSATLANQTDQATAATLIASNSARNGWSVYNDSTQPMYLKFGATASATDFTVKLEPNGGFYEQKGAGVYTGAVSGIWAADASGSARSTEW